MEGHFGKEAQILYYLKSAPGAAKFPPKKYVGNLSLLWGIFSLEGHFSKEKICANNNNNNAGRGGSARKSADSQHSSPRCSPAQLRRPLYLKVFREKIQTKIKKKKTDPRPVDYHLKIHRKVPNCSKPTNILNTVWGGPGGRPVGSFVVVS